MQFTKPSRFLWISELSPRQLAYLSLLFSVSLDAHSFLTALKESSTSSADQFPEVMKRSSLPQIMNTSYSLGLIAIPTLWQFHLLRSRNRQAYLVRSEALKNMKNQRSTSQNWEASAFCPLSGHLLRRPAGAAVRQEQTRNFVAMPPSLIHFDFEKNKFLAFVHFGSLLRNPILLAGNKAKILPKYSSILMFQ